MLCVLALDTGVAEHRTEKVVKGHIRYKLMESSTGIQIRRVWVHLDEESPFSGQTTFREYDESLNRLFNYEIVHNSDVSKERLHDLLIYLSKDSKADITFNNRRCIISPDLAGPVAIVQDHPRGFIVRLAKDPNIKNSYKGGLVQYPN